MGKVINIEKYMNPTSAKIDDKKERIKRHRNKSQYVQYYCFKCNVKENKPGKCGKCGKNLIPAYCLGNIRI